MSDPICVLLLPAPLEQFILRDQAEDLLRADGVVAVDPPRAGYGASVRLPGPVADGLAARQGRRLLRALRRGGREPRVVVIFHAVQYPVARALAALAADGCELWYWRWDRYEHAYDASPARARAAGAPAHAGRRARDADARRLDRARAPRAGRGTRGHARAPRGRLVPRAGGGRRGGRRSRSATSAGGPTGRCCAPSPSASAIAWCCCWSAPSTPTSARTTPTSPGVAAAPQFVWLGRVEDEAAGRLVQTADVGIVPFKVEPFNDAGLPYRILKYARLGRRTVSPELAGVHTWERAVTTAADADAFAAALLDQAGARVRPDLELRAWALEQTARAQNEPLWEALAERGRRRARLALAPAPPVGGEAPAARDPAKAGRGAVRRARDARGVAVAAQRLAARDHDRHPGALGPLAAGQHRPGRRVEEPARVGHEPVVGERERPAAPVGAARAGRRAARRRPRASCARKRSSPVSLPNDDAFTPDEGEARPRARRRPRATTASARGPARSVVKPSTPKPATTQSATTGTVR